MTSVEDHRHPAKGVYRNPAEVIRGRLNDQIKKSYRIIYEVKNRIMNSGINQAHLTYSDALFLLEEMK